MFAAIRNAAIAAITAVLVLGGAGQARADILYTVTTGFPASFSWETTTFLTPPTTPGVPVPVTGLVSCTLGPPGSSGPCPNTPSLEFLSASETEASVQATPFKSATAAFLTSDFGAVGSYCDVVLCLPAGADLTVRAVSAAPEPASLTLLALGLAGLGMVLRTRRV